MRGLAGGEGAMEASWVVYPRTERILEDLGQLAPAERGVELGGGGRGQGVGVRGQAINRAVTRI
jgi:hypothetical protein